MPTDWCSTMVITAKKNGKPRRTIDYQHLNSQCKRETHYTGSPFQLALQVSPKQKQTVFDVVNGYHSVLLNKESQSLTTFLTEWRRFMYLRMLQGYLASGDAFIRRYDEIIKDIPAKFAALKAGAWYLPAADSASMPNADTHLSRAKLQQSHGHWKNFACSLWVVQTF